MSSRRTPRRIAALAALSLVALAACGSSDDPGAAGSSVPAPAAPTTTPSGPRPPTPIEFTSGAARGSSGVGSATAEIAAADGRMATDMMIAPTYVADFVVGDALPALPTADIGYVYTADTPSTPEQAAELAAVLGVAGEPVRQDDWEPGGWQVGPTDGSAPALFLSDDAQHMWSYSPAWNDEPQTAVCSVAGSPDGSAPADTVAPECAEPEPPTGVLSAAAARTRSEELLTALGVAPAGLTIEPYADEWSASVTATEPATGRSWSFGFGAEGAVQWANGMIGVPEPVGPYPLIDLDAAVARLQQYLASPVMPIDLARTEPALTDAPEPAGELPVPASFPEPQPVTVTLVDVVADLWWAWDAEGNVWLVPAYRFVGDDGGWYTVPAVTDEYLVQVEPPATMPVDVPAPPATTFPAPTEPAPSTVPSSTVPTVTGSAEGASLEPLVGSTIEEFTAEAEAAGWTVRVTEIDGVAQPGTMDYRTDRVNVAVRTAADGTQTVTAIISVG